MKSLSRTFYIATISTLLFCVIFSGNNCGANGTVMDVLPGSGSGPGPAEQDTESIQYLIISTSNEMTRNDPIQNGYDTNGETQIDSENEIETSTEIEPIDEIDYQDYLAAIDVQTENETENNSLIEYENSTTPTPTTLIPVEENEALKEMLHLLSEGNRETSLSTNHTDIILVLGNTGAGKSTMTLFLAGNNSELLAYEKDPVTILIKDTRNKISNSTITSQTIFPELVIDPETNTAFYDCPGFSDTRSTPIEIANAFFIKKIADHAKRVKILLVVNHNSVKPGGDRKDFVLLLQHTTDFLKNTDIQNFSQSIGLLATKVESRRNDARIIGGIAKFLKDARSQVDQVLDEDDILPAQQLLDILLEQNDDGEYTKLTFFRQPDDVGPLSEMEDVQDRKLHMKEVIWDNMQFTEKPPGDFGFSISEQAKKDIRDLTDAINQNIKREFKSLGDALKEHYQHVLDINPKNESTANYNLNETQAELETFFTISQQFQNFTNVNNATLTNQEFLKILLLEMPWPSNVSTSNQSDFGAIIQNGEYLDFFQNVAPSLEPSPSQSQSKSQSVHSLWTAPISNFIHSVRPLVADFCISQYQLMYKLINAVRETLTAQYIQQIQQLDNSAPAQNLTALLRSVLNSVEVWENLNFTQNQYPLKNVTFSQLVEDLLENVTALGPSVIIEPVKAEITLVEAANFVDFIIQNERLVFSRSSRAISEMQPVEILDHFKKFLPQIRSNLSSLTGGIHRKMGLLTTALASAVELYYIEKLKNETVSTEFLHQLHEDASNFEVIFQNIQKLTTTSVEPTFIVEAARNFTNLILNYSPAAQILSSIQNQGEALDILKNYSSNSPTGSRSRSRDSNIDIDIDIEDMLRPLQSIVHNLNEILEAPTCTFHKLTLQFPTTATATENTGTTAIIKGTFVSLQQVATTCLTLSQGIQNVLITSLHTVFIDADITGLDFNRETSLNVVIIAPNWVVKVPGNQTSTINIILNGAPGQQHRTEQAGLGSAGVYSADGGGLNGDPGFPGGNAGNFIGIGTKLAGGNLRIFANGGTGSPGQKGGDGRAGFSAEDVQTQRISYTHDFYGGTHIRIHITRNWSYNYEEGGVDCPETHYIRREYKKTFKLFWFIPINGGTEVSWEPVTKYHCRDYIFQDKRATSGKRGGNGGAPGLGGRKGVISIIFPSSLANAGAGREYFQIFQNTGDSGRNGAGGAGGSGGRRGNIAKVRIHPGKWYSDGYEADKKILWSSSEGYAPHGGNGGSGLNTQGRQQPVAVSYSAEYFKTMSVNIFKPFANSNLEVRFLRDTLSEFLEFLETAVN